MSASTPIDGTLTCSAGDGAICTSVGPAAVLVAEDFCGAGAFDDDDFDCAGTVVDFEVDDFEVGDFEDNDFEDDSGAAPFAAVGASDDDDRADAGADDRADGAADA